MWSNTLWKPEHRQEHCPIWFLRICETKKKLAYVSALARCVFKVAVDPTFEDVCVYSIERCV